MFHIEGLSFAYPGSQADTLQNISFSIAKGEIFGFLGPSGSGKSTTQKILYKLLSGYRGKVAIDGKDLAGWGRDFYERIGVCFELPNHYLKLSALENLNFFGGFYSGSGHDPLALLDRVGLKADANKRVSDFSKGMKVRLNFIRALLHDPDILFLDEPTSGLDPNNAKILKDIIQEQKAAGKTIFLTTHNMFDADQLCDRVALIDRGRIVALDTPAALKLAHGKSKVLVGLKNGAGEREFDMEGLGANTAFLEILKRNQIETIHSEEATLEDAFIKITGKQLQ